MVYSSGSQNILSKRPQTDITDISAIKYEIEMSFKW